MKLRIKEGLNENVSGDRFYIEDNNGGRMLLACSGGNWYYLDSDSNGTVAGIDIFDDINKVKRSIERALRNGDIEFDLDYWDPIPEYDGMTIDDIDNMINYETSSSGDRLPKGHDESSWVELNV